MTAAGEATIRRTLVSHFIRRFVDNDFLSAHGDRHESLVLAFAAVFCVSMFVTVLLCVKYLFGIPPDPGVVALAMTEDRFFLIAAAMTVMGLVAATQWDALSLDARDASILGMLPIRIRTLVATKAMAVGLFVGAVTVALAAAPGVLHPAGATAKLLLGLGSTMRLMAAHVAAVSSASLFAFLTVLGLRELLRGVLTDRWLLRMSSLVQAALVVVLTSAFLLLLGGAGGSAGSIMSGQTTPVVRAATSPALWFLGVAETITGEAIIGGREESGATLAVRSRRSAHRRNAATGLAALSGMALFSVLAYAWNSRRLPVAVARRIAQPAWIGWLVRLTGRVMVRRPVARAGFFFTVNVLLRSGPHRLAVSVATAVALALTAATVGGTSLVRVANPEDVRVTLWALQTFVLVSLVAGCRHALAIPAELRAAWAFQLAWTGDTSAYKSGVKRAVTAAIVAPAFLMLLPIHLAVFNVPLVLLHTWVGSLIAGLIVEAALFGQAKPPFISSYTPRGQMKLAPIYVIGILVPTLTVAAIERAAAASGVGVLAFSLGLLAVRAALIRVDRRRTASAWASIEDEPETPTQTLGLTS